LTVYSDGRFGAGDAADAVSAAFADGFTVLDAAGFDAADWAQVRVPVSTKHSVTIKKRRMSSFRNR